MSFNIKEIGLVLLLLIATGSITRYCTPEKTVYSTGKMQEELDSLTVLSQNLYLTKDQIQDSLSQTSKSFQKYVKKSKEEIASYSRITGELRLHTDSLLNVAESIGLGALGNNDGTSTYKFRDTTIHSSSVWGDSLLASKASAGIRNDSLYIDAPEILQLRPIRIDVATMIADDNEKVNTLVTSPDFQDLKVESFTTLQKENRFPWTEVIAVVAFILGYAL